MNTIRKEVLNLIIFMVQKLCANFSDFVDIFNIYYKIEACLWRVLRIKSSLKWMYLFCLKSLYKLIKCSS